MPGTQMLVASADPPVQRPLRELDAGQVVVYYSALLCAAQHSVC